MFPAEDNIIQGGVDIFLDLEIRREGYCRLCEFRNLSSPKSTTPANPSSSITATICILETLCL
jgi:hypothetical protein